MALDEGTYEGPIHEAKWTEWDDDGRGVLVLNTPVDVTVGEKAHKLYPALFFDSELITSGRDEGKTRMEVALEVLASMGVEVDMESPPHIDPVTLPSQLEDVIASVYTKVDDNGRQKSYLNRRSKPPIPDERVTELWGSLLEANTKVRDIEDQGDGGAVQGTLVTDDEGAPF